MKTILRKIKLDFTICYHRFALFDAPNWVAIWKTPSNKVWVLPTASALATRRQSERTLLSWLCLPEGPWRSDIAKNSQAFCEGFFEIIQICIYIYIYTYLYGCFLKWWVSPKSSILIGFSIINHPFWGTTILGNPHMYTYTFRSICMCPYHKDKGNPQSTTKKIEIST